MCYLIICCFHFFTLSRVSLHIVVQEQLDTQNAEVFTIEQMTFLSTRTVETMALPR